MEVVSSRFASFVGKGVKSGSKQSGSMYPTLTLTSTKDKFLLDEKAMALIGVTPGSNVVLIDINKARPETTDENERFYITKGWANGDQVEGAKIGKNGSFSYAGIYGAIQINDPEITMASEEDMVEKGKGRIYETQGGKEGFVATNKVRFRLEQYVETDEEGNKITKFPVAEGVVQEVYRLINRTEIEHESDAGMNE